MSALPATRRRFPIGPILLLLGLYAVGHALGLFAATVTLPISAPNGHAVKRHGQDAWTAIDWLESHPASRRRIDCPGGNPIWHDTMPDGREAVAVTTEGDWETARNITAMMLSPQHFERFVRNCGGRLSAVVGPTREN